MSLYIPPTPKAEKAVQIYCLESEREWIREQAKRRGVTMNQYVTAMVAHCKSIEQATGGE